MKKFCSVLRLQEQVGVGRNMTGKYYSMHVQSRESCDRTLFSSPVSLQYRFNVLRPVSCVLRCLCVRSVTAKVLKIMISCVANTGRREGVKGISPGPGRCFILYSSLMVSLHPFFYSLLPCLTGVGSFRPCSQWQFS